MAVTASSYHWEYGCENISETTEPFELSGGYWGIDYTAQWAAGNITLQKLAGNGTTWISALDPWTADGTASALLPAGTYRMAFAGGTSGAFVQMHRIAI